MALADQLAAGTPVLHVDWLDYAARLLGGGRVDWGDAAIVAGLLGRAQGLLRSDLVLVPLDRFIATRLETDQALRAAVIAQARDVRPMRALLGNARLRADIVDLLVQARAQVRGAALGIALPAPAALASMIAAATALPAPEINDDLVDDLAVLTADFLRALATTPIELLVLADPDVAHLSLYGPIARVADHYGWPVGVRGIDRTISPWTETWPDLTTMAIAADAEPEATLAAVAAQREPVA